MSKQTPLDFMGLLRRGTVTAASIDSFVENWHSNPLWSDLQISLQDYLGMTNEEYSTWVETGVVPE